MDYINRDNRILFSDAYSAHSNNIQSFGAVFMIVVFTATATNYFFIITNLSAALITPTLLSRLNNGMNPVLNV